MQTFDCMLDFNPATLKKFTDWQQGRGFADIMALGDRNRDCLRHTDTDGLRWWEFRNELLASTHCARRDVQPKSAIAASWFLNPSFVWTASFISALCFSPSSSHDELCLCDFCADFVVRLVSGRELLKLGISD
mmetsp:Transcript_63693/g.168664  ORF Transcript_63693/g.168664 Transcript_63693/m.168664 type:complete len:133 (-) Transcript_63693:999-1397(-)